MSTPDTRWLVPLAMLAASCGEDIPNPTGPCVAPNDGAPLHAQTTSADLKTMCDRERDRIQSGNDIGFIYTGPGAVELVARLNELYGISSSS
jgi:hypothetical protein